LIAPPVAPRRTAASRKKAQRFEVFGIVLLGRAVSWVKGFGLEQAHRKEKYAAKKELGAAPPRNPTGVLG